jgi:hypothetical protein
VAKAVEALNQAVGEHDMRMTEIAMEPLFKPLASENGFLDIEKKMGVNPSYQAAAVSSR